MSTTEPTTVPTETTAPTEAVQADVSQYALTDDISTYDAFNCYVVLIPDSINAKPTGFKVKVGDTVNGYKVLSLNSRTYEVHIDIGVFQSESARRQQRLRCARRANPYYKHGKRNKLHIHDSANRSHPQGLHLPRVEL